MESCRRVSGREDARGAVTSRVMRRRKLFDNKSCEGSDRPRFTSSGTLYARKALLHVEVEIFGPCTHDGCGGGTGGTGAAEGFWRRG
jgi:hypothetical protein